MSQDSLSAFTELTFAQVPAFVAAARSLLSTGTATIDLKALVRVDSSALAALLAIARAAPQAYRFRNPPESLMNLARLYGVDELLFAQEQSPKDTD